MTNIKDFIDYINKNKYYILFLIFIIHYLYWTSNIGADDRLRTLIAIYGSFSILLGFYNAYSTTIVQETTVINNQILYLNQLFQNITQSISTFFLSNKEMKYYYDELLNDIPNTDETIRNYNLEQILTNNILINVDGLINYIDSFKITTGTTVQIKVMEEKLLKLLTKFFKSKIFNQNWVYFKQSLALRWTIDYMYMNFDR